MAFSRNIFGYIIWMTYDPEEMPCYSVEPFVPLVYQTTVHDGFEGFDWPERRTTCQEYMRDCG